MSSSEHSQQSGRSRDEQDKFPWARTEFPSPGSLARGALVQSLVSSSWILVFQAGRLQLTAASPWSVFIPGGQQRPVPILERFPACRRAALPSADAECSCHSQAAPSQTLTEDSPKILLTSQ